MERNNEYSIEGAAPDRFNIYWQTRGSPRQLICVAPTEYYARVIVIALMEIDKHRGINWNNL